MLPVERQSVILSKLAESDSVRTTELATALSVTDETIRSWTPKFLLNAKI